MDNAQDNYTIIEELKINIKEYLNLYEKNSGILRRYSHKERRRKVDHQGKKNRGRYQLDGQT